MIQEDDFLDLNLNFKRTDNCASKLAVLLSLPTVIYLMVILSYFNVIALQMALHSVILIGLIYVIFIYFASHNAYKASCEFKNSFVDMKQHLKTFIDKHKVTLDETSKANADVEDFLADYTRNLRNTNFSSVASGIFPTLGILGTFISIAVSMPDFSSKTSAVLEQEISLLLSGVGTAFYVSIYGIFLSIWWIFFEKLGMSRFERDIEIIKENTQSFFWNKIEIEKIHFQKNIENYDKINAIFSNVTSLEAIEQLNTNLKIKLEAFNDLLSAEEMMIKSTEEFYRNNKQTQVEITQSYQNIATKLEEIIPPLNEMFRNSSAVAEQYNRHENHLENITLDLNRNIKELNGSLSNLSAKNLTDVYANIVKNIETMKKDSDLIGWKFNQQLQEFDENMSQRLSALSTQAKEIADDKA
jgi:biopolymer transport protein ExbB/TolQ